MAHAASGVPAFASADDGLLKNKRRRMSFAISFADILVQQPNVAATSRPSAIFMPLLTLATGSISRLAVLAKRDLNRQASRAPVHDPALGDRSIGGTFEASHAVLPLKWVSLWVVDE